MSKNMNALEVFKKQGGFKLISDYIKAGCLGTALAEFLLLGKSRTALEILRLSTQLKTSQKLKKKYRNVVESFDVSYDTKDQKKNNVIWVCWFQGMENAPDIVKKCYLSLQRNIKDREIILITNENLYKYVHFPDYIQQKIDKGIITGAHLSDLIRLELLINYGGTWIDSTVFVSGDNIPGYMLDSELFLFQNLKPGRDGHSTVISNWFITAWSNNRILELTRELLYAYWKSNDSVVDYYIFHVFFQMAIEQYPAKWSRVVPFSNSTPHILLLRLFDEFDKEIWNATINQVPFHKLSYRLKSEDVNKKNTFYSHIMKKEET